MSDDPIIACCGISCSDCAAYCATRVGDMAALAAFADRWKLPAAADALCDGCVRDGDRLASDCADCAVRRCARARGLTSCADCPEYACAELEKVFGESPAARARLEAKRGR